jgi:signal peptidase II
MQAARGGLAVRERALPALFSTAAAAVAADQITKVLAVARLDEGEGVRVIDGALRFTLERNPGAAFSLFRDVPQLFTVLAFAVAIVIVVLAPRVQRVPTAIALGLVLGGAVGNLIDRLARSPGPFRGEVVDFIKLPRWPAFNLADAAVVVGAVVIALDSLRRRDGSLDERARD